VGDRVDGLERWEGGGGGEETSTMEVRRRES